MGIEPSTFGILGPKVVGSIPTVARHIFQACPVEVWIHTQSNIANITMSIRMPNNDKDPVLRIERKLAIINEGGVFTKQIKLNMILSPCRHTNNEVTNNY